MKLTSYEKSRAGSIMDALLPGGVEPFAFSATDTGALRVFEEMVEGLPFVTAFGLRAAVWLVELAGPAIVLKRPRLFSSLSSEEQEECMKVMASRDAYLVRNLVLLFKSAAGFAWGGDERVREALGMNEPPRFVDRSGAGGS